MESKRIILLTIFLIVGFFAIMAKKIQLDNFDQKPSQSFILPAKTLVWGKTTRLTEDRQVVELLTESSNKQIQCRLQNGDTVIVPMPIQGGPNASAKDYTK